MRLVWPAVASLLAASSAWGQRPKVAILDVSVAGDAPAEIRGKMEKSLAGGLYAAGFDVVRRDDVRRKLRAARELEGCTTPTCLAKVEALVGAGQFVRGRVETEGASYTIALELYAAEAAGGLVRRQEKSCTPCTLAEANEIMSGLASTIFVEPKPAKVALAVDSSPPGAAIRVDGVAAGNAPVSIEVDPGDRVVRAELPGRAPVEQKVTVDPAAPPPRLTMTLAPMPAPPPPPPVPEAPAGRYGAWKWVTAGGAAAAMAGGVALIAINGSLTDCPAVGICKSKYDTLLPGLALVGAGLALGGLAVYFILDDKPAAAALVPLPGGAGAVVRGRF